MIRIYKDTQVPKYVSGGFAWDYKNDVAKYDSRATGSAFYESFVVTNDFHFKRIINPLEEGVFRQEYQKPKTKLDYEYIQVDDIRDLVLFLAPADMLRPDFLRFIHEETVTRLFRALIIYFEYFLKVVEFAKIRRHEMTEKMVAMQTAESLLRRQEFGNRLMQYRIGVAREYSQIVVGMDNMSAYYHTKAIDRITRNDWDQVFHESLLAVATQVVWIAMHRRAYKTIDWEMNRLFRSEHFLLSQYSETKLFSKVDLAMLYGRNYKRVNFRWQLSPLMQEIKSISRENRPILNFHRTKYEGNDVRMKRLEMEFSAAESQLLLIDAVQGILGHPKKLYNTLLELQTEAVRDNRYNESYDPYHIVRQPELEIPPLREAEIRQFSKKYGTFFHLRAMSPKIDPDRIEKWLNRDLLIKYFGTTGILDSCLTRAEKELASTEYGATAQEILSKFKLEKEKLAIKHQNRQRKITVFQSRINKYGLTKLK